MLPGSLYATDEQIARHNDAMFAVLGGIYLLGADAPLSCPPTQIDALTAGFFQRLQSVLEEDLPQPGADEQPYQAADDAIRSIFSTTPTSPSTPSHSPDSSSASCTATASSPPPTRH